MGRQTNRSLIARQSDGNRVVVRMEYTLDESKRILIIEKEGKGANSGGLRPETGGGVGGGKGGGQCHQDLLIY